MSGCSRYQYASLAGNLPENKEKQFISENDTVRIVYSFTGNNCPVTIKVFNKLKIPVYVDWSKSAVIINDKKVSLWRDNTIISAAAQGANINWNATISSGNSEINGTLHRNEKISFIPPRSFVKISRILLRTHFFNVSKADSYSVVPLATTAGGDTGKKYLFREKHSPLQFKTFISLSTKQNFSTPSYFENSFWVNEITESFAKPNTLVYKSANQCDIRKATAVGTIMSFTIGISLLILGLSLHK